MMQSKETPENEGTEILIVEDSPTQAQRLRHTLERHQYAVSVAGNGVEALASMGARRPSLVISDVIMPEMDGYELCRRIRADRNLADTPVILLTQLSGPEDVVKALQCGADNFVTKPYDERFLISRIHSAFASHRSRDDTPEGNGLAVFVGDRRYVLPSQPAQIARLLLSTYENAMQKNLELAAARDELRALNEHLEELVEERTTALRAEVEERRQVEKVLRENEEMMRQTAQRLQKAMDGAIQAMASMLEMRDPYTAGHQRRVSKLASAVAEEMGLPEERIEGIRVAGNIHDIGKICVPSEILSKPGRISEFEFNIMKSHPQAAAEILQGIEFPWPISDIVSQHHERVDGQGYPAGLVNGQILLEARILAVADVVEAMASHRPYRPALGVETALQEISRNSGVAYDPDVVHACQRIFSRRAFSFD